MHYLISKRTTRAVMLFLHCKLITCLFLLFLTTTTRGQGNFNNWKFGDRASLDFNTTPPTSTSCEMNQAEGCATVSDNAGALLFYTDGVSVWDKNNAVMLNGRGLAGSG